ncbi:22098_t:CDS:2, partial [Gigaspora margarita]
TTQIRNHKEYITSDRVSSICDIIEESLFEELNASKYWSLMIDESSTISDDKHLAIVAKYLINNIPHMRYFGMLNLEETNALYIFTQLKSFFESKNSNFKSLIHFGSDGASTMLGNLLEICLVQDSDNILARINHITSLY